MTSSMTRLEINVLSSNANYDEVATFASRHKCNAVVVNPSIAPMILSAKFVRGGKFKVISAVDFPYGKTFGLDKIKRMDHNGLNVDGFDIIITPDKTQIDSSNEIKAIVEFIRSLNPIAEIRMVVGYFSRKWDVVAGYIKPIEKNSITAVRVDQHLLMSGIDAGRHIESIKNIRQYTAKPLILSCGIDIKVINETMAIDKNLYFSVTMDQAKTILKDLKKA